MALNAKRRTACPACGKTKQVNMICCWNCWQQVPLAIRIRFKNAKPPERRQILRGLHAAWKGRA